jgi:hypothetical protein
MPWPMAIQFGFKDHARIPSLLNVVQGLVENLKTPAKENRESKRGSL